MATAGIGINSGIRCRCEREVEEGWGDVFDEKISKRVLGRERKISLKCAHNPLSESTSGCSEKRIDFGFNIRVGRSHTFNNF